MTEYFDKLFKNRKKRHNWPVKIGSLIFYGQMVFAFYLFVAEIRKACLILSADTCPANMDLQVYHYFRLALIIPIVALSFIFTILEIISKLDFSFEKELVGVFIFFGWFIFLLMELIAGPVV